MLTAANEPASAIPQASAMGFTRFFSDISNPPNRVYLARAGHKFGFFGFIHGFTDITRDGDATAADGNYDPANPTPTSGTVCSTISFFTLKYRLGKFNCPAAESRKIKASSVFK